MSIICRYGNNQQLEADTMPFYDNTDSTKYIESDNVKIYQSAILKNSSTAYWILLFNDATDVINQYASGSRPTTYYSKQGNNCYSRYNQYQSSQVFQKTTLSGIEIYYNDSQNSDSLEPWDSNIPVFYNDAQGYKDYITNLAQSYSWETVQSISGKLGTVNLARIKDDYINDGEPVSGAAKSRFNNLKDGNKVSVLIENVLPDPAATGTDVTVKYDVPSLSSGSYTYCKLVAKKNSMPENVEDGNKIIDLDPTKASVTVKYLSGNTKYYFEIFTQDSEGHEGVSNVKSITTGEAHDIVLFTDELNEDILVDDWDIATYRSGWANGSTMWSPEQFSSDFLSKYNLFVGNSRRRPVVLGNGELTANCETSMTDSSFWIPIQRSIVPEEFKIEFDGNVSPQGSAQSYYNYIYVAVGCVDSNNSWHQSQYVGGIINDGNWVHYEVEITNWTYGYIDYIGLNDCDGQPRWKNVKVTVG